MTDTEFLNDLQTRATLHVVLFVSFDELKRLTELSQSVPMLMPADRNRYGLQAVEAYRLVRLGHQHLARQVAQQLRK